MRAIYVLKHDECSRRKIEKISEKRAECHIVHPMTKIYPPNNRTRIHMVATLPAANGSQSKIVCHSLLFDC